MSLNATLYIVNNNCISTENFLDNPIEKIDFNESGFAFAVLSAYSKEVRDFDWEQLEYSTLSNDHSNSSGTAITIFSIKDREALLTKLNPAEITVDELENFAAGFSEDEEGAKIVMEANKLLCDTIVKITNETALVLDIG